MFMATLDFGLGEEIDALRDTVRGWAGSDTLDGGDDSDALTGGSGDDVMRGGAGDDRVGEDALDIAGEPPDLGNDTLDGGTGNDTLIPGAGPGLGSDNDGLSGGAGFDSVLFQIRSAPVTASIDNQPNDGVAGEADNVSTDVERLVGGQAEDVLVGSSGGDTIDGFRGVDTIRGGAGADILDGGVDDAESDDVAGGDGDDQVRGSAGDDLLAGDEGSDLVDGGGGADRASGGDGLDTVTGGAGIDDVAGGAGNDTLDGSGTPGVGFDGGDTVDGGAGDDSIEGGDGDDTMAGGSGVDTISGELGSDTVEYASARSDVAVTLNNRADDGEQGEGDNVRTDVENVSGGGVQDTFTGSGQANTLDGGTGQDYVDGKRGRDRLLGGGAVDVVRARDGRRDVVDCGRSTDFAIVDRMDRVKGCERSDSGRGGPTLGKDFVVRPATAGAEFGPPEASRTVPLRDRIQIPVASFVDSSRGAVRMTASGGGRTRASVILRGGLVSVVQRRRRRAVTELTLKGGNFRQCRVGRGAGRGVRATGSRRRAIRRVSGSGSGRFKTNARNSSATIRGTVWEVIDRCDGTLTRVRRGRVVVRDFRKKKTVIVRAGQSYLARAASP
jgi:Ca2+-binding RTX toxin-like protein